MNNLSDMQLPSFDQEQQSDHELPIFPQFAST